MTQEMFSPEQHLSVAQAQEIQGAFDALRGDLDRMDPAAHAELVAPISEDLALALDNPTLRELASFYDERNAAAKSAQGWHFFSGRWAAMAVAGAVLATLPLVLLDDADAWTGVRRAAVAFQGLSVLLAGGLSLYIYLSRPRARWLTARSDAEAARRIYYKGVVGLALPLPDAHALTLKLEFFRRFQMDTQRDYYAWKQPSALRDARRARRAYIAGLVISAIAATPALLESASLLFQFRSDAATAEMSPVFAGALALVGTGSSVFAACGVVATALLGAVATLAALDTSRRNAESFRENLQRLDEIARSDLESARLAARTGDAAGVAALVDLVDRALASEQGEWAVIGRSRETA